MPYVQTVDLLGYEYAWENYVKYDKVFDGMIPQDILDSWKRCKEMGLKATQDLRDRKRIDELTIKKSLEENKDLIKAARHVIGQIFPLFPERSLKVWVSDECKNNIFALGKKDSSFSLLYNGTSSDERDIGTNSMDLAIRLRKPMCVLGAQHYMQEYHYIASYSAPIIVENNKLVGAIGMDVKCEEMNEFMLTMIISISRIIENELKAIEDYREQQTALLEKDTILETMEEGLLYIDEDRKIKDVNPKLLSFLEEKKENLIGKPIETIHTIPNIKQIADNQNYGQLAKIKLKSKNQYFQTLLRRASLDIGTWPVSKREIWAFTILEEVCESAKKLEIADYANLTFDSIIGKSLQIKKTIELAKRAAQYNARVILEGESGTGKEILAQSIHNGGALKEGPFIAVDCGAIPKELMESEMFGYVEGAFTGAKRGGAKGKFELADKGTLFLDEVTNLSVGMQAKLLRVLQENRIVRIGDSTPIPFDAQIIVATNKDLYEEVRNGNFRLDLLYRLDIIHIKLPPLRERREDIPLISQNYIMLNSDRLNKKIKRIDESVMRFLVSYDWPGNVRQLTNVLERMMIFTDSTTITSKAIPNEIMKRGKENAGEGILNDSSPKTLKDLNLAYVCQVLNLYNGNIKKASNVLGISRVTLYRYIDELENVK